MSSIFSYTPSGYVLRPIQVKILAEVEANWDTHDVIVIPLSVGGGKSCIAITIAKWQRAKKKTVAITTPQVVLQQQYADDFPDVPILKGKSRYPCESAGNCEKHYDFVEEYCEGCPYQAAKALVRTKRYGVFNNASYLFMYRTAFGINKETQKPISTDVLIPDEAHNLFDILSDFYSWRLYKKKTPNYNKINTIGDALVVMEKELVDLAIYLDTIDRTDPSQKEVYRETKRAIHRLSMSIEGIQQSPKEFFFEKKAAQRNEYINIKPINFSTLKPHILRNAKKIILMSGTINRLDVDKLGLGHRSIYEVGCYSAIDPERRPVIYRPVANMGYKYQDVSIPIMARALVKLIDENPDTKGLIHIPYQLGEKMRAYLDHPRLLWHGKEDKAEQYAAFREAAEPLVLVASGMSEGIDLPYDAARWQAITKIMYPSLADPLMQYYSQKESTYYSWLTIRTLIQASGRVCRTPTDQGTSFILDIAFENLWRYNRELFLPYFVDALQGIRK